MDSGLGFSVARKRGSHCASAPSACAIRIRGTCFFSAFSFLPVNWHSVNPAKALCTAAAHPEAGGGFAIVLSPLLALKSKFNGSGGIGGFSILKRIEMIPYGSRVQILWQTLLHAAKCHSFKPAKCTQRGFWGGVPTCWPALKQSPMPPYVNRELQDRPLALRDGLPFVWLVGTKNPGSSLRCTQSNLKPQT